MLAWSRPRARTIDAAALSMLVPYAYLTAIYSVFEKGSKYYLPAVLPLFVLWAVMASDRAAARPSKSEK